MANKSFSTDDREALLKEIGQIRAALEPDQSLRGLAHLYEDDEDLNLEDSPSEIDDFDDDGDWDNDYIPEFQRATKTSAWYGRNFPDKYSSCDEEQSIEEKAITVNKNAAHLLRRDASTPSSFLFAPLTPATDEGKVSNRSESKISQKFDTAFLKEASISDPSSSSSLSLSSLECALQQNRNYQEIIKDELIKINCALNKNKRLQNEIENRKNNTVSTRKGLLSQFRPTYLKDQFGQGPPDNEDTKERKLQTVIDPFAKGKKLWTEKERKLLAEGVRNQNLEKMTFKLKSELNDLERQAKKNNTEVDNAIAEDIKKRMEGLRKLSKRELEDNLLGLDFFKISKLYVSWFFVPDIDVSLPNRSEDECRVRWVVLDHPRINQSPWTNEEDAELVLIARKYNNRHWERIAEELGVDHANTDSMFSAISEKLEGWTTEEDDELARAINICPKGDWQQVANLIEGRAAMQVMHRWNKTLKPGLRKGPWTEKENKLLVKYANIYGPGNWGEIAKHIPGRTDASARDRWVNNYKPGLKLRTPWTDAEDELLLKAIEKHGPGHWTRLSEDVPGRTDNMCANRWKIIRKDEYNKYRERLAKKKELLSYFVGRNHERPNLDYEELDIPGVVPKKKRRRRKKQADEKGKQVCKQNISPKRRRKDENALNDCHENDKDVLVAYDYGDAEYMDVKRELFLLKMKILKQTEGETRLKLQAANDKQFARMEAIYKRGSKSKGKSKATKRKAKVAGFSDGEHYSSQITNECVLNIPLLPKEDTVYGPENIGIKPIRPVQVGHMPSNLVPFTLLLEAFHIDIKSVMESVKQPKASMPNHEPSTVSAGPSTSSGLSTVNAGPSTNPRTSTTSAGPSTTSAGPATDPGPSTVSAGTSTNPGPSTVRVETSTSPGPSTARVETSTSPGPSTARVETSTSPGPSTARVETSTSPGPSTARVETSTSPGPSSGSAGPPANLRPSTTSAGSTTNPGTSTASAGLSTSPGPSTGTPTNDKNDSSTASDEPSIFHSILPIAPSLVTLKAFRGLLLHRPRLQQLAALAKQPNLMGCSKDGEEKCKDDKEDCSAGTLKQLSNQNDGQVDDLGGDTCNASAARSDNGNERIASSIDVEMQTSDSSPSFKDSMAYKALSARFNALFMWPALLSAHVARQPVFRSSKKTKSKTRYSRKRRRVKEDEDVDEDEDGDEEEHEDVDEDGNEDDYAGCDDVEEDAESEWDVSSHESDDFKPRLRKKKDEAITSAPRRVTRRSQTKDNV
eukprot:gene6770-7532_t